MSLTGLIIDSPHIDNILDGLKSWEMRTTRTTRRGRIALIRKKSGTVIGTAKIVDSIGPLGKTDLLAARDKHLISEERLSLPEVAKYRYAWVLADVVRLEKPVPYKHPSGAVIWVALSDEVSKQIP